MVHPSTGARRPHKATHAFSKYLGSAFDGFSFGSCSRTHMHIAVDGAHLDTHRRSWRHALAQAHILAQARRSCRSRTGAHPCTGNAHRRGAHVAHAQALMAHTHARTSTRTASTVGTVSISVAVSVGVDRCGWRGLVDDD